MGTIVSTDDKPDQQMTVRDYPEPYFVDGALILLPSLRINTNTVDAEPSLRFQSKATSTSVSADLAAEPPHRRQPHCSD